MQSTYSIWTLAVLSFFAIPAVYSSPQANKRGIVPTTYGQIGVNPVSVFLANPTTLADVGVVLNGDTSYISVQGSSTKWIGVNTEYLTDIPSATSGVQASATTLTAATDGASVGDVNIILTPALVNKLTALAESVCGSSKHRKRDQESCAYNFINEAAAYPEFSGLDVSISLQEVANLVALAAEAGGAAAGSPTAQAAGLLAIIWWQWEKIKAIPNLIKIPAANVGPSAKPTTTTPTTTTPTTGATSASSSAPCPTGTDIAACDDTTSCSGQDNKCTSGEYKGCPCVNDEVFLIHSYDPASLASQQAILATLATITAAATATATGTLSAGNCGPTSTSGIPGCWGQPGCAYYLAGDGQGCPGVDYCACDGTNVPLLTSTVSGKTTSGCGYTTQPTANHCPTTTGGTGGGGGGTPTPTPASSKPTASSSPTPAYSACYTSGVYNMRQASAVKSASAYCKGIAAASQAVSGTWPGTCAVQNNGAVYQPPANGQVEAGQSDIVFTSGQDVVNNYCKAKSYSDLKFSEDDCNTAMGIAINNCQTNTVDTKVGGKASINCMTYGLIAANFGAAYPCTYLNVQFCSYGWISPCKAPS